MKMSQMASIPVPVLRDTLASGVKSWTVASPHPATIKELVWSVDIPLCRLHLYFIVHFTFQNVAESDDYYCVCSPGFTGKNCSVAVPIVGQAAVRQERGLRNYIYDSIVFIM